MPATLLTRSELREKVESVANSYLDDSVGNLLWAGPSMELLKGDKIVFEVPIMCTLNENYYKVGSLFIDIDTMEIIQGISDSSSVIKDNIKNLMAMR